MYSDDGQGGCHNTACFIILLWRWFLPSVPVVHSAASGALARLIPPNGPGGVPEAACVSAGGKSVTLDNWMPLRPRH